MREINSQGGAFFPRSRKLKDIQELVGQSIEIAIDTEFFGSHTLTIQAACRVDQNTIVKLYRSEAIPRVPDRFRLREYLPATEAALESLHGRVIRRSTGLITAKLSPSRLLRDLYNLSQLSARSRQLGLKLLSNLETVRRPTNAVWNSSTRRFRVPTVNITLIGHFLAADFSRVFSREFYRRLLTGDEHNQHALTIADGKVLSFAETDGTFASRAPIVEYAVTDDGRWFGLALSYSDLMHPFGPASLDRHCQTFLRTNKSVQVTEYEKGNMLAAFHDKTREAYGYAASDAVNTLLVHEQMKSRHREMFESFACPEELVPPMQGTSGRRTADFLLAMTRLFLNGGSRELSNEKQVKSLMQKGGAGAFANGNSKYGPQTGQAHGGLLYSRTPTTFWHEAPGQFRDVDMAACYNGIIATLPVYWGRPVILDPGSRSLTLVEAVDYLQRHAAADGWFIRVTGDISEAPNTLIPSTLGAVTSENFQQRRPAAARALSGVAAPTGSKLFSRRIESGVVTQATWTMIQALPPHVRAEYESLAADSLVFYPAKLVAQDGADYDKLCEQLRHDDLPWFAELDLDKLTHVAVTKINHDYVSLQMPLHDYARRIADFRRQAQQSDGKGSGSDLAWKLQANTMYGVLASPYFATQNVVAANQITATARARAFSLMLSLNGLQVITDGCSYRRDRIPACTFAECLEIMPDYPLRHAEDDSGIPFCDPRDVPADDASFTIWFREHAKAFFSVDEGGLEVLLEDQKLEHKLSGGTASPAFDGIACDGSGNYVKCLRTAEDKWKAGDVAGRGFGRRSKDQLTPWLIETYSKDSLKRLPPITQDVILLKLKEARQKAWKALMSGIPEVLLPLGMEFSRTTAYKALKLSAFVFQSPSQRDAIVKQFDKFCQRTCCGLEVLALRRSYQNRRQGSLSDLAWELYRLIQAGERDLTKRLNLTRSFERLEKASAKRIKEIEKLRAAAEAELYASIDVRNISPAASMTGIVMTADDFRSHA